MCRLLIFSRRVLWLSCLTVLRVLFNFFNILIINVVIIHFIAAITIPEIILAGGGFLFRGTPTSHVTGILYPTHLRARLTPRLSRVERWLLGNGSLTSNPSGTIVSFVSCLLCFLALVLSQCALVTMDRARPSSPPPHPPSCPQASCLWSARGNAAGPLSLVSASNQPLGRLPRPGGHIQ